MSGLLYTVSIQDAGFIGEWVELAAFCWFADARAHALRTNKSDKLNRFVRISFADGRESIYFRGCVSADHLFEEAA